MKKFVLALAALLVMSISAAQAQDFLEPVDSLVVNQTEQVKHPKLRALKAKAKAFVTNPYVQGGAKFVAAAVETAAYIVYIVVLH